MKKLGVLLEDFGPSQISYSLLKSANDLLSHRTDVSIYGFYENLYRPVVPPSFSLMNSTEIFGFDGILVTTTALQTYNTVNFPRPSKRIYYAWDVEWLRHTKGIPPELYIQIFNKPNLEIWTRTQDQAALIKNCFNVDVKLNENFDLDKFL